MVGSSISIVWHLSAGAGQSGWHTGGDIMAINPKTQPDTTVERPSRHLKEGKPWNPSSFLTSLKILTPNVLQFVPINKQHQCNMLSEVRGG